MFDFLTATVADYRRDIRRRWWLVVAVVLGALVVGVVPVLTADDVYAASVQVRNSYANPSPLVGDPDDVNAQFLEFGSDLVQVGSGSMRERAAEKLDGGYPAGVSVGAALVPFTTIVVIDVRAPTAVDALRVAQAYGESFVDLRTEQILDPLLAAADRLDERIAATDAEIAAIDAQIGDATVDDAFRGSLRVRRASLVLDARHDQRRSDELTLEAQTRAERIMITTDAVVDPEPLGQNPIKVALLAGVLGLVVGMALAVGLGRFAAMRAGSSGPEPTGPDPTGPDPT